MKLKLLLLFFIIASIFSCSKKEETPTAAASFSYSTATATFVSGGTAASSVAPTFSGGTAGTYSTTSTLPTGVTLNATTGVISWTGTIAAGTYPIVVKNANATATVTFTLTVTAGTTTTTYAVFPVDFESTPEITLKNDLGGVGSIVDNPKKTGNTSNKALKIVKGAGEKWANVQFVMKDPIDFSTKKSIKVDVYSPRVGAKFLLKIENATDASINKETTVATTKANEWETLEFNFSSIDATKSYQRIVLIFDIDVVGDGSANYTFHLDNFTQVASTVTLTAATLPMTFEAANTDYSGWTGFNSGLYVLADNPAKTGINTSLKAAKYTKGGTELWGGVSYTFTTAMDFSTNKAFKMKVYSPKAGSKVLLKIENGTEADNKEVQKTITAANTWEEFEFYFAPTAANYKKLVVFFDGATAGNGDVFYFDDITQVVGTPPAAAASPTTAPAAPTAASSSVLSLYSEATEYGNLGNTNPNWGGSVVVSEVTIAGAKMKKTPNYLPFDIPSLQNLSTKAKLHFDIWVSAKPAGGAGILIELVNAANYPTVHKGAYTYPWSNITVGQWNSVDIDLTAFTQTAGTFSLASINQVILDIVDDLTGNDAAYFTNVYFYGTGAPTFSYSTASASFTSGSTGANSVTPTFTNGTAGTYATTSTLPSGVTLDATTGVISWTGAVAVGTYSIVVTNANAAGVSVTYTLTVTSTIPATLPMTFEAANTDYSGWTGFEGGAYALADNPNKAGVNTSEKVAKYTKGGSATWAGMAYTFNTAMDFSTNKAFKMKVYSPNAGGKVLLKIENGNQADNKEVEKTITAANTWEELEFYLNPTAANYTKLVVIFDNGTAGNGAIYYFDDITQVVGTAPAPTATPATTAPTPTTNASEVISLYSDTYTPGITGINFNPNWGQATAYSETTIVVGNNAIKYANLNYQGTQFAEVNLSTKTTLHIDFWTPDMTSFKIALIGGGETLVNVDVPNKNQWGSIDIPLTSFTAVDLSKVIQMKVEGSGTLYLDNIYFYGTTTPPVIPVPTTAPAAPTAAASSVLSLYSEAIGYGNLGNTNPGWSENVTEVTIAGAKMKKTPNFLPFDIGAIQNLSGKTKLHFDIWVSAKPAGGAGILIKLAKGNWPAANDEGHYIYPWSNITAGEWKSVDIDLSSFVQVSGTFSLASIDQVLLDPVDDLGGGNAAYFSNVYFY